MCIQRSIEKGVDLARGDEKWFFSYVQRQTHPSWFGLFLSLYRLKAGGDMREKIEYVSLHPLMPSSRYIPVNLQTTEQEFTALCKTVPNTQLLSRLRERGPYAAMHQETNSLFQFRVKMKGNDYLYSFIWDRQSKTRAHLTVRRIEKDGGETLLPVLELCPSANAVAGFLYNLAVWVDKSSSRLPGWDRQWKAQTADDFVSAHEIFLRQLTCKPRRFDPPAKPNFTQIKPSNLIYASSAMYSA